MDNIVFKYDDTLVLDGRKRREHRKLNVLWRVSSNRAGNIRVLLIDESRRKLYSFKKLKKKDGGGGGSPHLIFFFINIFFKKGEL